MAMRVVHDRADAQLAEEVPDRLWVDARFPADLTGNKGVSNFVRTTTAHDVMRLIVWQAPLHSCKKVMVWKQ